MSMETLLATTKTHSPDFDPALALGRIHSILSALIQHCRTRAGYLYTGCYTCELQIHSHGDIYVSLAAPNDEAKAELLQAWEPVRAMDAPDDANSGREKPDIKSLPQRPSEYPPLSGWPPKPSTRPSFKFNTHERTSGFNGDFRPPAEEIYERLGNFFPEHNLDEPVIEVSSDGTLPTSAEAVQPLSTPDMRKHKKSIRMIANEYKQELDRTSRITSTNNANMLRKRSTKILGSKMEEVTAEQVKNATSTLSTSAESSSEPKRVSQRNPPGLYGLTMIYQRCSNGFGEGLSRRARTVRCTWR